jgi:hypothetical protein
VTDCPAYRRTTVAGAGMHGVRSGEDPLPVPNVGSTRECALLDRVGRAMSAPEPALPGAQSPEFLELVIGAARGGTTVLIGSASLFAEDYQPVEVGVGALKPSGFFTR